MHKWTPSKINQNMKYFIAMKISEVEIIWDQGALLSMIKGMSLDTEVFVHARADGWPIPQMLVERPSQMYRKTYDFKIIDRAEDFTLEDMRYKHGQYEHRMSQKAKKKNK